MKQSETDPGFGVRIPATAAAMAVKVKTAATEKARKAHEAFVAAIDMVRQKEGPDAPKEAGGTYCCTD